jgi:5'-3' exonuclease|tara:strand:- start:474 stop:1514 length:1041 start_codon:yes stop_codon:yes gene_type:complete
MKQKELFKLLDEIQEQKEVPQLKRHDRVLVIDGLNLFFRNFAMLNMVNPDGVHIGGLGGFLRSLGALIRQTQPTSVYVVFDGAGSTTNRKNLLPEYKSGRNLQRITNWEVFEDLDDEHDSKVDQIVRLIQYLKLLPIKTTIIDKVEADDIIAVLSQRLVDKFNSTVFVVSSDKDFVQLITDKIILYRPIEKEYYTPETVKDNFGVLAENFIIYKTLLGDNSDKIPGVKGLGEKGIFKKFPELAERKVTMEEVFDISARKYKEHVVYSRIVQDRTKLENSFKIMDLSIPFLDDEQKEYIEWVIDQDLPEFHPKLFIQIYNEDKLGGMIRNLDIWLDNNFTQFKGYKN